MKFGCNYSDILMKKLEEQVVDVDYVKMGYFGPFMNLHEVVSKSKPILIHGYGWHEHIGMVRPDTVNNWALMNDTLRKYENEALVVHFSIYEQDMMGRGKPREILEQGIKSFKEHMKVPIMIENMDHNPMYNRNCVLKEAVDPDYINEICEKYDLNLLLDTAHASVSAYHMNMDIYDYMNRMPLKRVKEVHFIGTQLTENQGLKDMHTPLMDRDYELLDWLMDQMSPEIITLEYGWPGKEFQWRTQGEAIVVQLNEIRRRYGDR